MIMNNLYELLKQNEYPGRGIVVGKSDDGENAVVAYFIMGRSETSRNRMFVGLRTGINIRLKKYTELENKDLLIYSPVKTLGTKQIITNGTQTDAIWSSIKNGGTMQKALDQFSYESDEPNFTPRISAVVSSVGKLNYDISIIRKAKNSDNPERCFYKFNEPISGYGHLIHTYEGDGNPLPSFKGSPKSVRGIKSDIDDFTSELWNSLNDENKVALFVRFINLKTSTSITRIINK